jgi:hypothetical protein
MTPINIAPPTGHSYSGPIPIDISRFAELCNYIQMVRNRLPQTLPFRSIIIREDNIIEIIDKVWSHQIHSLSDKMIEVIESLYDKYRELDEAIKKGDRTLSLKLMGKEIKYNYYEPAELIKNVKSTINYVSSGRPIAEIDHIMYNVSSRLRAVDLRSKYSIDKGHVEIVVQAERAPTEIVVKFTF